MIFHGFTKRYQRKGIYNLEEVFSHLGEYDVDFDGDKISLIHDRYELFARSLACHCGLVGLYFAKERAVRRVAIQIEGTGRHRYQLVPDNPRCRWHFNLYAMHENGTEVLMTKDHIIPRSRGGRDKQSNYETMCEPCNRRKGSMIPLPASTLCCVTQAGGDYPAPAEHGKLLLGPQRGSESVEPVAVYY